MRCGCDMKGFLGFLILWTLSQHAMNGAALAQELARRRGTIPSPGTLYPALKDLKNKGLIVHDGQKTYSLTTAGTRELDKSLKMFCKIFADFPQMRARCH